MATELVTLRDRTDRTKILHPETEAAAVVTNTPGKTLDKALSSGVSYTEGPTGGVSTDNLSGYYSKTQVDELLEEKEDKPSVGSFVNYLDFSKKADYLLYQGNFPGHNFGPNSITGLTTVSAMRSAFASREQTMEANKSYLCFYAEGATGAGGDGLLHARSFTIGSDGSSITWNEDYAFTPGAKVLTPKGIVYEFLEMPTSSSRIYDLVNPSRGKIPLELANDGYNVSVNYLSNCDIKIHASSSVYITLIAYSTENCSINVDSSGIAVDSNGKARINFVSNGTAMRWPKPTKMRINQLIPGTWGNVSEAKNNFEFDPFSSGAIVTQSVGIREGEPNTQLEITYKLKDPALVFDNGSKYRFNFQVDFINTTPEISFPMIYEEVQ